ncbi:MAG: hypothetical protein ACRDPY_49910 [Streptosporangiaceae bacterium]
MRGLGLARARETVETAAAKVTASAELTARAIGAVAGLAIIALAIALLALVAGARANRVLDAARA